MSDYQQGWNSQQRPAGPEGWAAPTGPRSPDAASPPPQATLDFGVDPGFSTSETVSRGSGGRLALIAALLGAAVLLAGAGWFAIQALTASDGAQDPEAATDALIDAINNEDFLTMAELLEPGERRAIAAPVLFEIIPELQRLGVLGDDFDSSNTDGLEIEFADVAYRVDRPADSPDVAFVYFTGGTSTVSLDVDEFQLGSRLRTELEQDPATSDELGVPETTDLASDTPIVMVERDGRWYVSMVYTVMEGAFPGELPATVAGLTPIGAGSPEAAVEELLNASMDLDLRGLIQGFEPGEMHALHRYSPLFLDDAQASLDEFRDALDEDGVDITLSNLDLERTTDGDNTVVNIRGFVVEAQGSSIGSARFEYGRELIAIDMASSDGTFDLRLEVTPRSVQADGTIEGESFRVDITGTDDATNWSLDGQVGAEAISATLDAADDCWAYRLDDGASVTEGCLADDLGTPPFNPADLPTDFAGLSVVVAETDGQWYVSPIGSVMHWVVSSLRNADELDVDQWFETGDSFDDLGGLGFFGNLDLDDGTTGGSGGFETAATTVQATLAVSAGETVIESGNLGANEQHRWTVDLADGEVLAATLEGQGASGIDDPVLDVYDAGGVYLGGNDDYIGLNSGLRLAGPGTYDIGVAELSASGGDYLLTVEVADGFESLTLATDAVIVGSADAGLNVEQVEDVVVVDLSAGPLVVAGSVADNAYDEYLVTGTGQSILIELVTGPNSDLDPYLVVRDESGFEVAANDDDGSGELPALSSRILLDDATGLLTIEARSLVGRAGDYEIRISVP